MAKSSVGVELFAMQIQPATQGQQNVNIQMACSDVSGWFAGAYRG